MAGDAEERSSGEDKSDKSGQSTSKKGATNLADKFDELSSDIKVLVELQKLAMLATAEEKKKHGASGSANLNIAAKGKKRSGANPGKGKTLLSQKKAKVDTSESEYIYSTEESLSEQDENSDDSYQAAPRMDRVDFRRQGQASHQVSDSDEDPVQAIRGLFQPSTDAGQEDQPCLSGFQQTLKDLTDFFNLDEELGPPINEAFARIIASGLRRRPSEDAVKAIMKQYPRPENVPNLLVPCTNKSVWKDLSKGATIVDGQIQKVQTILGRALTILLKLIDEIGSGRGGSSDDHLRVLSDAMRCTTASFSMLNQTRKDVIRNDQWEPMSQLCTWDAPVMEDLFGVDVKKWLKEQRSDFTGKWRGSRRSAR